MKQSEEIQYEHLQDKRGRTWVFQITIKYGKPYFSDGFAVWGEYAVEVAEVELKSRSGKRIKIKVFEGQKAQRFYQELM